MLKVAGVFSGVSSSDLLRHVCVCVLNGTACDSCSTVVKALRLRHYVHSKRVCMERWRARSVCHPHRHTDCDAVLRHSEKNSCVATRLVTLVHFGFHPHVISSTLSMLGCIKDGLSCFQNIFRCSYFRFIVLKVIASR